MAYRGHYATEAAGAMPGWDPERAGARVEEQRARQLRDHFGLQLDDDLAYAFESFEDVVRAGGQALAVQWVEARVNSEQSLLHDFIQGGALGPTRAMNPLKWLNKAGSLKFDLSNIVVPTPQSVRQRRKQQAIVVEPPMLPFLEQVIAQCWESSNPKWTALLAFWLMRLVLRDISTCYAPSPCASPRARFICGAPKASSNPSGEASRGPCQLRSPTALAGQQLRSRRSGGYPADRQSKGGVVFNENGIPWALPERQKCCQEVFQGHVQDVNWRRLGPTIGQLVGFDLLELNVLGGLRGLIALLSWILRRRRPPLCESSTRLGWALREHRSWDVITRSEIAEAKELVKARVDRMVSQDMDTKWQGKTTAEQVQRAFMFSQATRESARATRASASINNKLFTKYMRNGQPLCAGFQTHSCLKDPCDELHKCAIVVQSG